MDSGWIIGIVALMSIGGVVGLAYYHFFVYLKDPKYLEAIAQIEADRASAATKASASGVDVRSLRERLDAAPGIDDRLSTRATGVNLWDALFDTKWSRLRATVTGEPLDPQA